MYVIGSKSQHMRSHDSQLQARQFVPLSHDELEARTLEIEQQKREKQAARLRRAAEKEAAKKRQRIEKLIAPILLVLTVALGILVQLLFR